MNARNMADWNTSSGLTLIDPRACRTKFAAMATMVTPRYCKTWTSFIRPLEAATMVDTMEVEAARKLSFPERAPASSCSGIEEAKAAVVESAGSASSADPSSLGICSPMAPAMSWGSRSTSSSTDANVRTAPHLSSAPALASPSATVAALGASSSIIPGSIIAVPATTLLSLLSNASSARRAMASICIIMSSPSPNISNCRGFLSLRSLLLFGLVVISNSGCMLCASPASSVFLPSLAPTPTSNPLTRDRTERMLRSERLDRADTKVSSSLSSSSSASTATISTL
mmetsp:Transcript_548/g.1201  ORF Transcript_548/g.1201 Transcript_548/m.1201 type:complete len:285 (-) Transcript_548:1287-2141(-)